MEFGYVQKNFFSAAKGAYSVVTEREIYDSQITLTDSEAELVITYFGPKNIHIGNVKTDPKKAQKEFWSHFSPQPITLNLVFPKPGKNELRLYLAKRKGFMPDEKSVWFIYIREGRLYIGSMSLENWRSIGQVDYEDEKYQDIVNLSPEVIENPREIKKIITSSREIVQRNPKLALHRFKSSNYKCDFDNSHRLFVSRTSCMPYIEAHHLIPICYQNDFKKPLDNFENIFSLCPYCHSAIHHADKKLTLELIEKLAKMRRSLLKDYKICQDDVLRFYNCEEIV